MEPFVVTVVTDPETGDTYLQFSESEIAHTVPINGCVNVDLDVDGKVVGIEVLK